MEPMNSTDLGTMDSRTAIETSLVLALIWVASSWFLGINYETLCSDLIPQLFSAVQEFIRAFILNYTAITGLSAYIKRKEKDSVTISS
jgi:uncharacterized protein YggT (Ycf19 family)